MLIVVSILNSIVDTLTDIAISEADENKESKSRWIRFLISIGISVAIALLLGALSKLPASLGGD